jgi:hypothetical protein
VVEYRFSAARSPLSTESWVDMSARNPASTACGANRGQRPASAPARSWATTLPLAGGSSSAVMHGPSCSSLWSLSSLPISALVG